MAATGAARGIVVSAGDFTPDARDFARGRNIDLVNGRVLAAILRGRSAPMTRFRRLLLRIAPNAARRWLNVSPARATMPATRFGDAARFRAVAGRCRWVLIRH
jgi:hypothetical protein